MGGLVNNDATVETGNLIGVTWFITGSISLFGDQIILSHRIFSVETGEILSSNTIRGPLTNLFSLQEQLAGTICRDLQIKILPIGASNNALSNFETYQDIEYLKKLASTLPRYILDPKRKIRTGDYLNAIEKCDAIIKNNPGYYLPHYYKGLFAMHLGETQLAERESAIALELAPSDFESLFLKSIIHINSHNSSEALGTIKIMNDRFQDEPEGWYLLSKVQTEENDMRGANESLLRSLLGKFIIPQAFANLRSGLGTRVPLPDEYSAPDLYYAARLFSAFWQKQRETPELRQMAEKIKGDYPSFFLSYYITGHFDLAKREFNSAIDALQSAITIKPDFPESHRDLSLCCFNVKLCDKAEQHANLYLRFSDAVSDYPLIEEARKKCK